MLHIMLACMVQRMKLFKKEELVVCTYANNVPRLTIVARKGVYIIEDTKFCRARCEHNYKEKCTGQILKIKTIWLCAYGFKRLIGGENL